MLPKNEVIETLFAAVIQFASSRYIAILILAGLFTWAHLMVFEFNSRVLKYTDKAPPERHWLMLQCIRWERSTAQMRLAAVMTLFLGFFIFMFAQMIDDIIVKFGLQDQHPKGELRELFMNIQIAFYFFFMTLKLRTLWDATGVYFDLKKVKL